MRVRRRVVLWLVRRTRGYVRCLAEIYGMPNHHCEPMGQHPVEIEGENEQAIMQIPASVLFNTHTGRIFVGRETVFGEDVQVLTGKHLALWEAEATHLPLHHVPESGRDINIGRGCYIGSGAMLIGPLRIGDYAVVGAGSVVTRDVQPRTFVAGIPARALSPGMGTRRVSVSGDEGGRA